MQLKYGSYAHKLGTVGVNIRKERMLDAAGQVESYRHLWDISGLLTTQVEGVAAARNNIKTQTAELEAAYASDGLDLVLYMPDGTKTHHELDSSQMIGGVRITSGPNYQSGPSEAVTIRRFQISAEAIEAVPLGSRTTDLVAFTENLQFRPSGPKFGFLETPRGRPIKQQLRRFQVYEVAQSGQAVGRDAYPLIPAPLWPFALVDANPLVTRGHPRRIGNSFKDWPVSWTYLFRSNIPLAGSPHIWGHTYTF